MFDLTEMEPCRPTVLLEHGGEPRSELPGRLDPGRLRFVLDPPVDDWLFLSMTRLELEILLPVIVQEIFELWRGNKVTQELVTDICRQIEQRIQGMVDKGMFIVRRPVTQKVSTHDS